MGYWIPIATKKQVIEWYKSQPEDVKRELIIERYLEASSKSAVYLKKKIVEGRYPETVFRIGRKGLAWFNLEWYQSAFVNVACYKVLGLFNSEPNPEVSDTTAAEQTDKP